MVALEGLTTTAAGENHQVIRYRVDDFDVGSVVADMLGVDRDLAALRPERAMSVRTRADDQQLPWHEQFYTNFSTLAPLYRRFVAAVAERVMPGPFYYQAVPTFRVHLPGNLAVGEFHVDRRFGHPDGEVTFWVPLTAAYGTNSLLVESARGSRHFSTIVAGPGEVVVFDAGNLEHGNVINQTDSTRVSFDFRCLPVDRYAPSQARTVNTGMRFAPGEYYAEEPLPALARDE